MLLVVGSLHDDTCSLSSEETTSHIVSPVHLSWSKYHDESELLPKSYHEALVIWLQSEFLFYSRILLPQ
jgi:hypothetical protein